MTQKIIVQLWMGPPHQPIRVNSFAHYCRSKSSMLMWEKLVVEIFPADVARSESGRRASVGQDSFSLPRFWNHASNRGRARSALRLHRPLGHPSSVAMSQEKPSLVDKFIQIPITFYANRKEDDLVASKRA